MNGIYILAAFAAGIGCGVLATRSFFNKKYKDIADKEIESVKAVEKRKKETKNAENAITKEYHKHVENYISSVPPGPNMINVNKAEEKESPKEFDCPYEISFEEYSTDGFYDKLGLTYYEGDGVLTLDDVQIDDVGAFADVEETIGLDFFEFFKSSEVGEMFIRNPNTGIDYDLVRDLGSYNE